jgi:hypothetical protein
VFDVKLWTGNGGTQTISGLGFSPDFVWTKNRVIGAAWHMLMDQVRGGRYSLSSNVTDAEVDRGTSQIVFNSDGFTVGTEHTNSSGHAFVGWAWDAGSSTVTNTQGSITSSVRTNNYLSVITYTGTGSNASVGHGLGVAPGLLLIKRRNTADDWVVWHSSFGATGGTDYLFLNSTIAKGGAGSSNCWNGTVHSSTLIQIGANGNVNGNGSTYVCYAFAPVAGYSAFGSYTGNGSADGPFVFCGFRPRWILYKNSSITSDWRIYDAARLGYNTVDTPLYPNLSIAENTTSHPVDILSNGFKIRGSAGGMNESGNTIVYAAFAESPFQYARAR